MPAATSQMCRRVGPRKGFPNTVMCVSGRVQPRAPSGSSSPRSLRVQGSSAGPQWISPGGSGRGGSEPCGAGAIHKSLSGSHVILRSTLLCLRWRPPPTLDNSVAVSYLVGAASQQAVSYAANLTAAIPSRATVGRLSFCLAHFDFVTEPQRCP